MMVFPDKVDKFTPKLGYLPGGMPIWIGEVLTEHGVTVLNADDNIDGRIHTDRELLTGDSPLASNNVGKAAAALLLEKYAGVAPADVAVALLQAAEVKE
jgi:molecular chaperone Hsp31 and glyoxalase 3